MAVEYFCPECGSKTTTRGSNRITPTLTTARVVCRKCFAITEIDLQAKKILLPKYEEDDGAFRRIEIPRDGEPTVIHRRETLGDGGQPTSPLR